MPCRCSQVWRAPADVEIGRVRVARHGCGNGGGVGDDAVEIGRVRLTRCGCGVARCDGRCKRGSAIHLEERSDWLCRCGNPSCDGGCGDVVIGSVRLGRCECGDTGCDGHCSSRSFCSERYCARRCSPGCARHCSAHCSPACELYTPFFNAGEDDCGLYRRPNADACGQCGNDDCDCDESSSRDDRALYGSCARGANLSRRAPTHSGGAYAWGGAIARVTDVVLTSRDDEQHRVPGAHIPIGFARYKSPTLNISEYTHWRAGEWRVAIRRNMSDAAANQLIARIMAHGPQSAGYMRIGDNLVPEFLSPSDRAALAGAARRVST
jgi:hypothetical protein